MYKTILNNPMWASYINEPSPGQRPDCVDMDSYIFVDDRLGSDVEALISYGPELNYTRDNEVDDHWRTHKCFGSRQQKSISTTSHKSSFWLHAKSFFPPRVFLCVCQTDVLSELMTASQSVTSVYKRLAYHHQWSVFLQSTKDTF